MSSLNIFHFELMPESWKMLCSYLYVYWLPDYVPVAEYVS